MDPVAHTSVALLAKPFVPKAPLWALVAATQVPDLLFFAFEAAGLEQQAETEMNFREGLTYLSEPTLHLSHGFMMTLVWSAAAGGIASRASRDCRTGAAVGLMVLSHWLLDFTVYPNMPLLLGRELKGGLGLITSGPGMVAGIVLEVALIASGFAAFLRERKRTRLEKSA